MNPDSLTLAISQSRYQRNGSIWLCATATAPLLRTAAHQIWCSVVFYVWLIRLISVVGSTDLRKCEWIAKKSSPNVKRRTATAIAPHENHSHIRGLPSQDIFHYGVCMGRINPKPLTFSGTGETKHDQSSTYFFVRSLLVQEKTTRFVVSSRGTQTIEGSTIERNLCLQNETIDTIYRR